MTVILDDLSTLPPKKLARRLEELAAEALPCRRVAALEASPETGLTVGLWVDDRGRPDVRDLVRVIETEPGGGYAVVAWAALSPCARAPWWRVLLRVSFERPVRCDFAVRIDPQLGSAPGSEGALLLAARRFALEFDAGAAAVVIPAPTNAELLRALAAV